ncbi:hypothetical protein ABC565_03365 [Mycoplasmopsis synoviae]|nr:hypothetical protein [Mycoplasmopsis synoviae]UBM43881.1 hypothetical protein LA081_01370 [Mycoplasmopsis synoviae]UZW64012.1 hypothetical protein OIE45_01355 [Mycoplasmopsis synoviae]
MSLSLVSIHETHALYVLWLALGSTLVLNFGSKVWMYFVITCLKALI